MLGSILNIPELSTPLAHAVTLPDPEPHYFFKTARPQLQNTTQFFRRVSIENRHKSLRIRNPFTEGTSEDNVAFAFEKYMKGRSSFRIMLVP